MQVKRFIAANMRLALKMVREEMGPDAIILSNKRVPEGVELLISMDADIAEQLSPARSALKQSSPKNEASQNPFQQAQQATQQSLAEPEPSRLELELDNMQRQAQARAKMLAKSLSGKSRAELEKTVDVSGVDQSLINNSPLSVDKVDVSTLGAQRHSVNSAEDFPAPSGGDELSHMRRELQSMRDLLEWQFSTMAWGQFSQQNPVHASLWKRLKRMGIDATIAKAVLDHEGLVAGSKSPSATIWQSTMKELNRRIPVQSDDLTLQGGVFAFVGPTGAGKTTTIGKLATRYVLAYGADNVALITTDTMRIAAHEQLRTFGRILNVPVKVVDKNNSLERVLHSLRHKALILIDTAGLTRHDERLKRQLDVLNETGGRVKTMLVIPATSQAEVIKANYHSYKTDNLMACVLTKLDEATSLGETLSLTIDQSLPIAYTTNGQAIPEDINVANSSSLIHAAIELAKDIVTDDDTMADELAASSSSLNRSQVKMASGI